MQRKQSTARPNFLYVMVAVLFTVGFAQADSAQAKSDCAKIVTNSIKMKLVYIPAGEFMMGSVPNEKDRDKDELLHKVTLSRGFYMGAYEVTQAQYKAVMGANPSRFKGDDNPVENVSWETSVEFCKKLSSKEGKTYKLPTEAQWEYACRAGTNSRFGFGDSDSNLADYAWYSANSGDRSHPVGRKKPNGFGLYDMHGNIWEWCDDWYKGDFYSKGGQVDPHSKPTKNPTNNNVLRGGGWNTSARSCRTADRDWYNPALTSPNVGFRVVMTSTTYDHNVKPRVIVSTDIGGSDPDDDQSMVHYFVYADMFDTEGLISSPPYAGRKSDILEVIDEYEIDYSNLNSHSDFPTPQSLRDVTKQGAINAAPSAGYSSATEGSNWIISRANAADSRPLWILVWGSITDVAQAVHDDPGIKSKIRVYSIGSWNTDQCPYSRDYLYNNHSDMWWIENNSTFRGMYIGGNQSGDLGNWTFVKQHVHHHGALGDYYYSMKADLKMGDTPSVLYLLNGDPDTPTTEHWGGMFRLESAHTPPIWTDRLEAEYREGSYDGAKTVNVHREAYLCDWQKRMDWASAP